MPMLVSKALIYSKCIYFVACIVFCFDAKTSSATTNRLSNDDEMGTSCDR